MISLINAKECAERLVIAERVARQATEAALRDADVRERDQAAVRKRLEAELAQANDDLAEAQEDLEDGETRATSVAERPSRRTRGGKEERRGRAQDEEQDDESLQGKRRVYRKHRRGSETVESVASGGESATNQTVSEDEGDVTSARYDGFSDATGKSKGARPREMSPTSVASADRQMTELTELVVKLRELVRAKDDQLESLTRSLRKLQRDIRQREAAGDLPPAPGDVSRRNTLSHLLFSGLFDFFQQGEYLGSQCLYVFVCMAPCVCRSLTSATFVRTRTC